tara:strand:- start:397 stop:585 length:189 start_codon:yes stop_codon:yes gene_type:complete
LVAVLNAVVTSDVSNRFIFAILAASVSYIAVPAAMKISGVDLRQIHVLLGIARVKQLKFTPI